MKPFFILAGRSASGKSYIADQLCSSLGLKRTITCTTRERRENEPDNAYYFLSLERFYAYKPNMIESTQYCGEYYGVRKNDLDESDFAILEPEGVAVVRAYCLGKGRPCYVIGLRCDRATVLQRLIDRGASEQAIKLRMTEDDLRFQSLPSISNLWTESSSYTEILEYILRCYKKELDSV